jgi:hypothetical protein
MKPVDPIHFFNARGQSILSADHLESENAKLRADNERLKGQVKILAMRLRTMAGDTESSISLNS